MAYAEGTTVKIEQSIAEISAIVRKNGGGQFAQMLSDEKAAIAFTMQDRQVRFVVSFGSSADPAFATKGRWSEATTPAERKMKFEARQRQRMRALLLVIKAKLESVESEVETFEQAFLANVVMPNGATLHELVRERVSDAYLTGAMPLLLEGLNG